MNENNWRNYVCVTCLSQDRHLSSIDPFLAYLSWMCRDVTFEPNSKICWECAALVKKFALFQVKAISAESLLRNESITPLQGLKSLSKLTTSTQFNNSYSAPDYFMEVTAEDLLEDLEMNRNMLIKTEIVKDEDDDGIVQALPITAVDAPNEHTVFKSKIKTERKNKYKYEDDADVDDRYSDGGTTDEEYIDSKASTLKQTKDTRDLPLMYNEKQLSIDELNLIRTKKRNCDKFMHSKYKCETCVEKFAKRDTWEAHVKSVHECPGKFVCKVCQQRFKTQKEMNVHSGTHFRGFECVVCGFISDRADYVAMHHGRQHEARAKRCPHCALELPSYHAYKIHKREKHGQEHPCPMCNVKCSYAWTLRKHIRTVHEGIPLLECSICHNKYKGEEYLKGHMKRMHSDQVNEAAFCSECGIQFKTVALYKQHLLSKKHVRDIDLKHQCPHCDKRFVVPVTLRRHVLARHTDRTDFPCHICSKAYTSAISLRRHLRDRHPDKPKPKNKVCEICAKAFSTTHLLTTHMRTHTGERPFACDLCPMRFAQQTTLRTHVRGVHEKCKKRW